MKIKKMYILFFRFWTRFCVLSDTYKRRPQGSPGTLRTPTSTWRTSCLTSAPWPWSILRSTQSPHFRRLLISALTFSTSLHLAAPVSCQTISRVFFLFKLFIFHRNQNQSTKCVQLITRLLDYHSTPARTLSISGLKSRVLKLTFLA